MMKFRLPEMRSRKLPSHLARAVEFAKISLLSDQPPTSLIHSAGGTRSDYPAWKAPADDGAMLLWPTSAELLEQTRENHARLHNAESILIQNKPLSALRTATRQANGQPDDQILIATGHQTELHHPGVWAKNLLLNAAAPTLTARSLHIAVDTDAPKHLNLRWPGESKPQSQPISNDPSMSKAAWSGLLAPPPADWIESLQKQTGTDSSLHYPLHGEAMLGEFWPLFAVAARESASLDEALTSAMHQTDRSLGLQYESVIASTLWTGTGFLTFAHHVLARARHFTADYNGALAEYRAQNGIDSTMRPMPDLFTGHGAVEAPFWLDDLGNGTRIRPSVFDDGEGFRLDLLNGDQFYFDPNLEADRAAESLDDFLHRTNHRLSPRALTLTMFVRLLLADQFVHGIGGGRYDQVTDEMIRRHFKLQPPHFSVTTATLIYPGAAGRERVCLPCLRSEGHYLKHAVLAEGKQALLRKIKNLPRKSVARAEAFASMQQERHAAILTSEVIKNWQTRLEDGRSQFQREKTTFDRELFYGIQPRDRLTTLIERYQQAFAG